jgi:hypothetical protein
MGKKFIISESEISEIRKMYGLLMEQVSEEPVCTESGCKGRYTGPEFKKMGDNTKSDIAHQYSNVITKAVAAKLKDLYKNGIYSRVNFSGIKMETKGMGTGNVTYTVDIPFERANDKCDARTGFAHVGGWGHEPELQTRKKEIWGYIPPGKSRNTVVDNHLDVSQLTTTPEGLEEYWIQWKHWDYQSDCEKSNSDSQMSLEKIHTVGDPNYKPISNSEADAIRKKIGSLNSTKELESTPKTTIEPKSDPLVKPEIKSVIKKAKRPALSPDEEL